MPRYTRKSSKRKPLSRSSKRTAPLRKPLSSAPKKQATYAPGPTKKAPTRRTAGPARASYARGRRGGSQISLWFKVLRALSIKYRSWFIVGYITLGVIVVALVFFLFFFNGGKAAVATATPSPSASSGLTEADDPFLSTYTAEELAGLSGEDGEYSDLIESDKEAIGVFIGSVDASEETSLRKLDDAIDVEYANKTVSGIYKYYSANNASDDFNAQIQGIRSLANRDVKAIVVCIEDEEEYLTIVNMAKTAGMRVVAVDAPVDSGYDINIVTDENDYGISIAEFIGDKVSGRANVAEFIDTNKDAGNGGRLNAFNSKLAEYSNLNVLTAIDAESGKSVSRGMDDLLDEGTIEAIYTDFGLATEVLNECIQRETFPKVFIGDATAEFIKQWYALMTTGVDIEVKVDEEDRHSETITRTVTAAGMQVYVRPTPEGAAATAVKFAIRLAEGKTLKTDMLTENKVYYYT
ncbi:MAG: substrate-binding domain-containing protein, partial [Eubacteriales bacterium]